MSNLPNTDNKIFIQLDEINEGNAIEFDVLGVLSEKAGEYQIVASSELGNNFQS
jgi:hypothetical protein